MIYGRTHEKAQLLEFLTTQKSEFVAMYGRRRVGKTFLIREVFNNQFAFKLTGMANVDTSQQLVNFGNALLKYNYSNKQYAIPSDWIAAFKQLEEVLEQKTLNKKIIFLDELPWLDTQGSDFLSALEHFWNDWASARKDITLIVCGSAASWMIKKLFNSKGGFHNRVTHKIKLEPFTLAECAQYFKAKNAIFNQYQIVQLYMAIGGIPFYLDQIDGSKSATQNINQLLFTKNGGLVNEFNNLYTSLFKKAKKHISIIKALATKQKGLTRTELLALAKLSNGGSSTDVLNELIECGFIKKYTPFQNKDRNSLYQLIDFFSMFYLQFVQDQQNVDENFWIESIDNPQVRAWSGYAFEQVCMAHLPQIKTALGINGMLTKSNSWISTTANNGAQIDLLIDRRDQVITICEIKFSVNTFTITKQYAAELMNKIEVFRQESKTNKAIHLVMISPNGITNNAYAMDLVKQDLKMEVLFGSIK
jgi:uncharacterized protein